ncbi:hypothetical protein [Roseateles amylovorans]|uniref:Uncharacterized protein n=1 Tax=Roseateles amylovorans TaxID=2978473 RepID=A0ABY6B215_9BURK|nr:hypothetical protein [Roseateles amylovorans]UXH78246.1 hypothetical protein N4261_25405 [Roseateles amylovorans]
MEWSKVILAGGGLDAPRLGSDAICLRADLTMGSALANLRELLVSSASMLSMLAGTTCSAVRHIAVVEGGQPPPQVANGLAGDFRARPKTCAPPPPPGASQMHP